MREYLPPMYLVQTQQVYLVAFLNHTYKPTKAIKPTNASIWIPNSTIKSITTALRSLDECAGVYEVICYHLAFK